MIFPSVRLNETGAGMSVDREAIRGLNAAVLWDQGNKEEVRKAGNAGLGRKLNSGVLGVNFRRERNQLFQRLTGRGRWRQSFN